MAITGLQQLAIDPNATSAMGELARKDQNAAIKMVAGQFEAMLLNQMMASMRESGLSGEDESSELGMFRNMHDQQVVQGLVSMGGFGLADMLAKQLLKDKVQSLVPSSSQVDMVPEMPAAKSVQQREQLALGAFDELPKDKVGFVEALLPHAKRAAAKLGVSAEMLVAHAALESGWGQRMLRHSDGRNSFNLFGIKATGAWSGERLQATTTEYFGDVPRKKVEPFRAYGSYAEAFEDYAELIQRSGRYKAALNAGENTSQYAQALQAGGYATDPAYAAKLQSVAKVVTAL